MSKSDGTIVINGKKLTIVTLDFETYYDKDYTLTKLSTSDYIRDPRFLVHGVGVKIGNKPTLWYRDINIMLRLRSLDWSKYALLCHHTQFDGLICHEHYATDPAFYLDTLSMSRAVYGQHVKHGLNFLAKRCGLAGKVKAEALYDTKGKTILTSAEAKNLGAYCVDDCDDTYDSFWEMYEHFPDDELELVDLTVKMFTQPVLMIDEPRAQAAYEQEVGAKAAQLLTTGCAATQLTSNPQFAKLLEAAGAIPPMKASPTTGKQTFAFAKGDLDFQALAKHPSQRVRELYAARLVVKSSIGETRALRFVNTAKQGTLPVYLHYAGAHTLRWSGGNKMNMQNLKRGGELRKSVLAPPGYVIVVADSAQIEARMLAWFARQMDILNAFANKEDVYKMMASLIYGVPVDKVTKDQRFVGKVCVLGLGYGMGAAKLQLMLEQGVMGPSVVFSFDECQRIVKVYRTSNYMIAAVWKQMSKIIECMLAGIEGSHMAISYGKGYISLPNGLFLHYPQLSGEYVQSQFRDDTVELTDVSYLGKLGRSRLYGGLLCENIIQALARIAVGEQMLRISKKYRVVTTTHDEIVVICKEKEAQKCLDFMLAEMSKAPIWAPNLPLDAEGGFAVNYSK